MLTTLTELEIKQIELELLDAVDKFCKEHNIEYFLNYGTLIGAIRHKGFIPWDDDIDLMMSRDNYDRFVKDFTHPRFKVLSFETDEKYYNNFIKVVDTKTVVEDTRNRKTYETGIFIDIFPYDALPKKFKNIDYIKRIIINQLFNGLRKTHKKINAPINIIKTIRDKIVQLIGKNIIVKFSEKTYRKNNDTELSDDIVVSVCFADYKKGRLKKTEFDNLVRMKFENITLNGFKNYDQILKNKYGNYMQLPPEDQRVTHGIDAYWK